MATRQINPTPGRRAATDAGTPRQAGAPRRAGAPSVLAVVVALVLVLVERVAPIGPALGASRPWLELFLALPVVTWAAYPIHRAAAVRARRGGLGAHALVSLGIALAFGWSLGATLAGWADRLLYDAAAAVTAAALVGRYVAVRLAGRDRDTLAGLRDRHATEVTVLRELPDAAADDIPDRTRTVEERISADQLVSGDRFVVGPGERIAADGVVLEGTAALEQGSLAARVGPGDPVTGGTVNTAGRLVVRAEHVGADTALARIIALVERTEATTASAQRVADRAAAVLGPLVVVLAALTFFWWLLTGTAAWQAASAAVAVLVIAAPGAFGAVTPTALRVGQARAADLGAYAAGPQVLRIARAVDTVVFDSTGPLTRGRPKLTHIATAGRLRGTAALQAAASVAAAGDDPIDRAIVAAARDRAIPLKPVTERTELPGAGARGTIRDTVITVGRADLFDAVPPPIRLGERAGTTVYVGWGGVARAALTVADEVRPQAAAAIERLRGLGLTTHLVTAAPRASAVDVARQVGIHPDDVTAQVSPRDRPAVIEALHVDGHVVALVCDGATDAAVRAGADLAITLGAGAGIALDGADIVLTRTEVGAVAEALALSRQTLRIIRQNLCWAFGFHLVALPLAALGRVPPSLAGLAMVCAGLLVVLNSLRLRTWQPPGHPDPTGP